MVHLEKKVHKVVLVNKVIVVQWEILDHKGKLGKRVIKERKERLVKEDYEDILDLEEIEVWLVRMVNLVKKEIQVI